MEQIYQVSFEKVWYFTFFRLKKCGETHFFEGKNAKLRTFCKEKSDAESLIN